MSLGKYRDDIDKLVEELILVDDILGNNVKDLVNDPNYDDIMKVYILSDSISIFTKYVETRTEGPKEDIEKSKKIALILTKIQLLIFNEENSDD